MESIRVKVDDREKPSGIPQLLDEHPEINCCVERLSLGDYLIDDWLLIERKQVADLIHSLITGRLFEQALRLAESELKTAILIEGGKTDIGEYQVHRHAILGALTTLSLIYGISILRSASPQESVCLMLFAARQKARRNKDVLPRCGYRPKSHHRRQLYLIQGLPGVGPALAKRLLASFGSVRAICCADKDALCKVEGIGPGRAEKIIQVLS